MARLQVGARVTATYRVFEPGHHAVPGDVSILADGRRAWAGVVLDVCDPEAWADTMAFSHRTPTRDAVAAHVAKCRSGGYWDGAVPVRWEFGAICWERPSALIPLG